MLFYVSHRHANSKPKSVPESHQKGNLNDQETSRIAPVGDGGGIIIKPYKEKTARRLISTEKTKLLLESASGGMISHDFSVYES